MDAEVHGLVLGFFYATIVLHIISHILWREVDLEVIFDGQNLFNVISKDSSSTERRLQIYIAALRKMYGRGEL